MSEGITPEDILGFGPEGHAAQLDKHNEAKGPLSSFDAARGVFEFEGNVEALHAVEALQNKFKEINDNLTRLVNTDYVIEGSANGHLPDAFAELHSAAGVFTKAGSDLVSAIAGTEDSGEFSRSSVSVRQYGASLEHAVDSLMEEVEGKDPHVVEVLKSIQEGIQDTYATFGELTTAATQAQGEN